MNAAAEERSSATSDREVAISRVFDAPRELVFEAFTDAKHVAQWWGPNGFTTTTQAMHVRVGGEWRFTMHGPDGTDFPNKIVYREVTPPARLAYRHSDDDTGGLHFDVTVSFEEEEKGKTRVTMVTLFPTAEMRDHVVREYGAIEGGKQTLERLARHLPSMREMTVSRTFDAPRELVFRTWTDPEHLKQWWGPKGMTVGHCTNDLRPGGKMHYLLLGANGMEMWGKWVYREIVPPERLEYVSSFSDAQGNTTRAPFEDEWPLEMLAIVTFDEADGKTTITLRWTALNANETEQATFDKHHASMQGGWGGTFDRFDQYLGSIR